MNDEEVEKRIEFILEHQAQFAANMQKVEERVSKVEDLMGRLAVATTAGFKELTEKVSAVIDAQIRTEETVTSLAGNISSLTQTVSSLTDRMNELAEAQAHTDQRLNVIIDIISEGRNGKSHS